MMSNVERARLSSPEDQEPEMAPVVAGSLAEYLRVELHRAALREQRFLEESGATFRDVGQLVVSSDTDH